MTARNRGSLPPGVGASPLPATRARVWWLASASGSSFPSADVRAPACGFGRVQPGLARRRRALEKARPESCHRLGQTRASDSRAVNRSTASGPVVIQHVGADLSTYWARTEQPLQKRHTQPLHGPDFVPYRRISLTGLQGVELQSITHGRCCFAPDRCRTFSLRRMERDRATSSVTSKSCTARGARPLAAGILCRSRIGFWVVSCVFLDVRRLARTR
jgi:hypothetical protein